MMDMHNDYLALRARDDINLGSENIHIANLMPDMSGDIDTALGVAEVLEGAPGLPKGSLVVVAAAELDHFAMVGGRNVILAKRECVRGLYQDADQPVPLGTQCLLEVDQDGMRRLVTDTGILLPDQTFCFGLPSSGEDPHKDGRSRDVLTVLYARVRAWGADVSPVPCPVGRMAVFSPTMSAYRISVRGRKYWLTDAEHILGSFPSDGA